MKTALILLLLIGLTACVTIRDAGVSTVTGDGSITGEARVVVVPHAP